MAVEDSCVCAVVIHQQHVLFVRQAPGQALAGQWSIPWGLVEEGEAPEDAARRETHEESGVTPAIDGLLGVQNLPPAGWIGIIFACHVVSGEPQPDGIETDQVAFFSAEDIRAAGKRIEPWCRWLALRVLQRQGTLIPEALETPYAPLKAFL
jgi:ADP-ribose pyrophosphatase YjhB (NUDIX family)